MIADEDVRVLPYSAIVAQEPLKRALEVSFIAPEIGGVLISGQRGTAKSTAVRAFAQMVHGGLPVTLPINATDDRVVGGWRLDDLMLGKAIPQQGLLEEAGKKGMLYVDEVNLLDDHLVNLILDVASTGVLTVQHDMLDRELHLSFTLVGTMNPEEGGLRPQLLDRFGLLVAVAPENDRRLRRQILETILRFDEARVSAEPTDWLKKRRAADRRRCRELDDAKDRYRTLEIPESITQACADLAEELELAGHRGDYVTAVAARALAALGHAETVEPEHVRAVAPMALAHRTRSAVEGGETIWSAEDDAAMQRVLGDGQ